MESRTGSLAKRAAVLVVAALATGVSLVGGAGARQAAVTLASIQVAPTSPSIYVAQKLPFTATGTYSDGSTRDLTSQVTWGTSNMVVATVSQAGRVTALIPG